MHSGIAGVVRYRSGAVDRGEREGYRVIVVHGFTSAAELVQAGFAELIAELTCRHASQRRDEIDRGRRGVRFRWPRRFVWCCGCAVGLAGDEAPCGALEGGGRRSVGGDERTSNDVEDGGEERSVARPVQPADRRRR